MIEPLPDLSILPIVRATLAEDLGRAGDVTSQACVPAEARLSAVFAARKPGVLAGLACARLTVLELDPEATFEALAADGGPSGRTSRSPASRPMRGPCWRPSARRSTCWAGSAASPP